MTGSTRLWRLSGMDLFGDDLASGMVAATPQALIAIREANFTGIWLAARLRDISRTAAFPLLGSGAAQRQDHLRQLVCRCSEAQLRLYLYLNEPCGFPADDPFWACCPEVRGAAGNSTNDGWDRSFALCTSVPKTLAFLECGCADLFAAVPGLGGVVCITASESHMHCYSHFEIRPTGIGAHNGQRPGETLSCPRCRERHPRDIVAEVLTAIERGVHQPAPEAEVIAWTWSWDMYDPPPQATLIKQLPRSIIIMSDFERGGRLSYRGRRLKVDEYSLIYFGPSKRCREQLTLARRDGRRVMVRTQINNTVEMATAPNLPLAVNLFKKCSALRQLGAEEFLASWGFGCDLQTLNVALVKTFFQSSGSVDLNSFLTRFAADYFGLRYGQPVVRAWQSFSRAVEPFPFGFGFLYFGPFNCSLVYPLPDHEPRTRSMKIWNFDTEGWGDRIEETLPPLSMEEMLQRLEAMHTGWAEALELYRSALSGATCPARATAELNVARYFKHLAHSTWTIYSWFAWRYHRESTPYLTENEVKARLREELANLEAAKILLAEDDRLGFYEENQMYYATPSAIHRKRKSVRDLLQSLPEINSRQKGSCP